jgi:A/G-specific adenine glycosylase
VVADPEMDGLLPEDVKVLEARVPGIGPYTAGAISAIVFGRAEALVDGNVMRVLSRQLGLLANVKSDKTTIDLLWAAADALVKDMARCRAEPEDKPDNTRDIPKSDRPGRWGQALMELGSTVCTPKPNCSECPISSTCRVYQEGRELAKKGSKASGVTTKAHIDIEDLCNLCVPLEETPEEDTAQTSSSKTSEKPANGSKKQSTLSAFFNASSPKEKDSSSTALTEIANHAKRFPLKIPKKAVREEETLVCAIRQEGGRYLIHRRPDKGLLAGLWEFPSWSLDNLQTTDSASAPTTTAVTSKRRVQLAKEYVSGLGLPGKMTHQGELGSVPWLFSHLKLTMHVHLFVADDKSGRDGSSQANSRWSEDIEQESMGTGMRKCWFLVREADG